MVEHKSHQRIGLAQARVEDVAIDFEQLAALGRHHRRGARLLACQQRDLAEQLARMHARQRNQFAALALCDDIGVAFENDIGILRRLTSRKMISPAPTVRSLHPSAGKAFKSMLVSLLARAPAYTPCNRFIYGGRYGPISEFATQNTRRAG